ncbi:MAG TPA: tRNA dihydrouridine synthase DusB [Bacteroidales bacterium]|nr:tRNA dihydrouridine synthase DusB [Bacteroidales bacterium]
MFADIIKNINFPLFLAPMEAVTGKTYRKICKQYGADVVISEFISSDALIREVAVSRQKMSFEEEERPFGIQLFGHNESALCEAAEVAAEANPDFIDINWGCPVKKIVKKGAGSAILKTPELMVKYTKAVVDCVKIPITVKTRLGWEENDKPIVNLTERLQDIGVQAITIHGRTRSQLYSGVADWTLIGEIKKNPRITIPIIGNGDINSAEKAINYKKKYGVDAIMIGRAAIGNPWIFQEIKNRISEQSFTPPSYEERVEVCLNHLRLLAEEIGEKRAVIEMRPNYSGYFKGVPHFKNKKIELMYALTVKSCEDILNN